MVEARIDSLLDIELMRQTPASWEDYLQRVANTMKELAYDYPGIFPLIATQPAQAPWLRPPLRGLRWVEEFLSTPQRFEFSDSGAVGAYKSFTSFLVGDLLMQVNFGCFDITGEDDQDSCDETFDLSEYPTVRALSDQLGERFRLSPTK